MVAENIIFIFGAGASKAAFNKMPLITEFFKVGYEYAQAEANKVYQSGKPLPNECELFWKCICAIDTVILDSFGDEDVKTIWGEKHPVSWIAKQLSNSDTALDPRNLYIQRRSYLTGFYQQQERLNANIEELLRRADVFAYLRDSDLARKSLRLYIAWLFAKLESEAKKEKIDYKNAPHGKLIQMLLTTGKLNKSKFISFNYDLLLEKSLSAFNSEDGTVSKRVWHPGIGYGFEFGRYFSINDYSQSKQVKYNKDSIIEVLKPHGSISWIRDSEDHVYPPLNDSDEQELQLADINDEFINRSASNSPFYPDIIPPAPVKASNGAHLWRIRNKIKGELSTCHTIVVIGWNIPPTDSDVREQINRIIDSRENQIEQVVVCDIKESDLLYDKFSMLFRPAQKVIPIKSGFNDTAIDEIRRHLPA